MTRNLNEYFSLIEVSSPLSWLLSQQSDEFAIKSHRLRQYSKHVICVDVGAKEIFDRMETLTKLV